MFRKAMHYCVRHSSRQLKLKPVLRVPITRCLSSSSTEDIPQALRPEESTQTVHIGSFFGEQDEKVHWASGEEASALLLNEAQRRDPNQTEFIEAVDEVVSTLSPVFHKHPSYGWVMKMLLEPERVIQFRVPWTDDAGYLRFNRGFRVQYNSALGPYKGGLRFHPSVNLSIMKFLAFEQVFKNSLTGLAIGGGKGGADFNPKGKSEAEIMRFCQSFMTELHRYIGPNMDVPAGDIGVGGAEIGYLFGQYKRISGTFEGCLTGKGMLWGGSHIRPEATGYGCVYIAEQAVEHLMKENIAGMTCLVSGAGNVAQYTLEKLVQLGAKPLTVSDSGGYAYKKSGFTESDVQHLIKSKSSIRGYRVQQFAKDIVCEYHERERPWGVKADLAFPSATQNEVDGSDAKRMVENGVRGIFEGANMPSTIEAIDVYRAADIIYVPGKAANAGGVATSGLEMSQNAQLVTWSREEVDRRLKEIMQAIFRNSMAAAEEYGLGNDIQKGANIAGFLRVANAMVQQGSV